MHLENLKIQLGKAYSKNYGASNSMGDGHGDFYYMTAMATIIYQIILNYFLI